MIKNLQYYLSSVVKRRDTKRAYIRVFNSDDGKIVMRDLIKTHFCNSPTFTENSDLLRFKEGKRALVLQLLTTVISKDDLANEIMQITEQIEQEKQNQE